MGPSLTLQGWAVRDGAHQSNDPKDSGFQVKVVRHRQTDIKAFPCTVHTCPT